LLAGLYAEPRPQVITAMHPITDPLGTWFKNDQIFPRYDYDDDNNDDWRGGAPYRPSSSRLLGLHARQKAVVDSMSICALDARKRRQTRSNGGRS
jgi:hypothetical protein